MTDDLDNLRSVRHQAVLGNPDGVELSSIMDALDTLDVDERMAWLDEHPEIDEEIHSIWHETVEGFIDALSTSPDVTYDECEESVEFGLDKGRYENTVLQAPDGERHDAGVLYFWATKFGGKMLIDIRERNIPDHVELVGSRLELRNDDSILLLAGEIVEEGGRTADEWLTNNQTVVLDPGSGS